MPAAKYDLILNQGDTWARTLTWKDPAGTPINLTGYTARMQIRTTVDATAVITELNTTPTGSLGSITLGGALGTIALLLTKEQSVALDFNGAPSGVVEEGTGSLRSIASGLCASFDLEVTSGAGVRTTLIRGLICQAQEVTR